MARPNLLLIFAFTLAACLLALSVKSQRLYIKPQFNFDFPLAHTIRQDYLPYARIENHHKSAVIMPGIRLEYLKKNGNGYFFNFTLLPVGFAVRYTDYAYIDP